MKIEISAAVDGEKVLTATFEDGRLTGATLAPGTGKLFEHTVSGDIQIMVSGFAAAVDAFKRATGLMPYEPKQLNIDLPRTITVGDTVAEPGRYYAITAREAKNHVLGHLIHAIISSDDDQALDTLLEAVRGVPIPVKEEPAGQPAPDTPEPSEPTPTAPEPADQTPSEF